MIIGDRLLASAPTNEGMHHVPLQGARPEQRDLADEIIEVFRLEGGDQVHLSLGFDLEHTQGLAGADVRVHRLIV